VLASIELRAYVDDVSTTAGQARVRFLHASPDAPAVDITLTDGTVLFGNVSFGEASSAYGSVPAGAYDLQVRLAGTDTVVLSFGGVAVAGGTTYTVIAKGLVGEGSLGAQVQVDAPGAGDTTVSLTPATAELRVAHLSPDAPNVDVWLDGSIVAALTDVPFQAVSGYLTVPAVTANVQVYVTGTSSNPVLDLDVTPLPGRSYTAAATGLVGQSDLQALLLEDDRIPASGEAQVRFVHASPDAPAVDVAVADGGPTLFSGVAFRESAGYAAAAPATYDLEVLIASNKAQALLVPGVVLSSGTNYTIFAIGLAGDGSLAALPVVDTP
jgi:hypothetical protein